MVKSILSLFMLLSLAGCFNLAKMNQQINESSTAVAGNIEAVHGSTDAINENSAAIANTTVLIHDSVDEIARGTVQITNAVNQIKSLNNLLAPLHIPASFLAVLVILIFLLPSVLIAVYMQRFEKKIDRYLANKK